MADGGVAKDSSRLTAGLCSCPDVTGAHSRDMTSIGRS